MPQATDTLLTQVGYIGTQLNHPFSVLVQYAIGIPILKVLIPIPTTYCTYNCLLELMNNRLQYAQPLYCKIMLINL